MKLCTKCNQEKEFSEFHKNVREKDGFQSYCKPCKNGYYKKYYEKDSTRYKQNNKRTKMRVREYVLKQKNNPCVDCGIKYPFYVMHFDHLDASTKSSDVSRLDTQFNRVVKEIAKCELVCANCHAIRTWQRAHRTLM